MRHYFLILDEILVNWVKENQNAFDITWETLEINSFFEITTKELKYQFITKPDCDAEKIAKIISKNILLRKQYEINSKDSKKAQIIIESFKNDLSKQRKILAEINSSSITSDEIGMELLSSDMILPKTVFMEKQTHCEQNCLHNGEDFGEMIECESCKTWYHIGKYGCIEVLNTNQWTCKTCKEVTLETIEKEFEKESEMNDKIKKPKILNLISC